METFVVRVWRPWAVAEGVEYELHGVVERFGSSEERAFRSADELCRLLRSSLCEPDVATKEENA